jgi:hypothetical protein
MEQVWPLHHALEPPTLLVRRRTLIEQILQIRAGRPAPLRPRPRLLPLQIQATHTLISKSVGPKKGRRLKRTITRMPRAVALAMRS